jgi:DNA topoisomerase-1
VAKVENFIANGEILVFPGFLSVYDYLSSDDKLLPNLNKGDALSIANFTARESFSRAKPRYTEASLDFLVEGLVKVFDHALPWDILRGNGVKIRL